MYRSRYCFIHYPVPVYKLCSTYIYGNQEEGSWSEEDCFISCTPCYTHCFWNHDQHAKSRDQHAPKDGREVLFFTCLTFALFFLSGVHDCEQNMSSKSHICYCCMCKKDKTCFFKITSCASVSCKRRCIITLSRGQRMNATYRPSHIYLYT